ncbi:MAG: GTPase HflX [Thiothrix lacustris]|uniref:GTPase HflX n=1 Tax=Thiothrix lacustris TaxID=525917 RepID=A0A1Y1QHM7_9GAMM|nr:MAG: GTPase HflX [Thiothrix lacustris]
MELFERPGGGENAVLVQISFNSAKTTQDEREFIELADSAGAKVVGFVNGSRQRPDPRYFVGTGKAEEIRQLRELRDANLVIFDHSLSPAQERNLEKLLECRVIDRTGLILDIFAQRARSHEGKLQVELAQLKHLSTRLVRGWTHLERQKGGIGMRGPGETQLETDRRLIAERIKQIDRRLEKVQNQREQGRQSRKKAEIPTVSLVGYTNAGKSTLFNALTQAGVYVADQLFATLDPTLRQVQLPNQQEIILADTVGFIRYLPHDLVAAFRSTLQETVDADLLLHVIDSHDDQLELFREQVNNVIAEIGAEHVPQIEVMNKIDLGGVIPHLEEGTGTTPTRIYISAQNNLGLDVLLEYLGSYFAGHMFHGDLTLKPQHARLRAKLYADKAIQQESITDEGNFSLKVLIDQRRLEQYLREEALALDDL